MPKWAALGVELQVKSAADASFPPIVNIRSVRSLARIFDPLHTGIEGLGRPRSSTATIVKSAVAAWRLTVQQVFGPKDDADPNWR
jgi:hypothetical protein